MTFWDLIILREDFLLSPAADKRLTLVFLLFRASESRGKQASLSLLSTGTCFFRVNDNLGIISAVVLDENSRNLRRE